MIKTKVNTSNLLALIRHWQLSVALIRIAKVCKSYTQSTGLWKYWHLSVIGTYPYGTYPCSTVCMFFGMRAKKRAGSDARGSVRRRRDFSPRRAATTRGDLHHWRLATVCRKAFDAGGPFMQEHQRALLDFTGSAVYGEQLMFVIWQVFLCSLSMW